MSILEVNNVSIRYMTGDFKDIGLKEYVTRKLKGNYHVNEFWADRNISFTLEKGDMLGIIGVNGAGKSTLLKAISGIMEPTTGYVTREGNIAALLELASGFDGDLTVRENAYLRGAMLGYTRKFMDETYDRIIAFAELQNFQERPFRQLSSGMKSRLAFSIASLVQPDILILDEVLSVGDGAFRKKSEAKMREIIAGGATTILVSHSTQQVRELCNKVLWLDHGEQIGFGDAQILCDLYQKYLEHTITLEDAKGAIQQGAANVAQTTAGNAVPHLPAEEKPSPKEAPLRHEIRGEVKETVEDRGAVPCAPQSSLASPPSRKAIGKTLMAYTALFALTFLLAYSPFLEDKMSFMWSMDGQSQHYRTLVYVGRYLRQIALNLVHGKLSIPLFDPNLALGGDVISTLNYYGLGDPLYLLTAFVPTHYAELFYNFMAIFRVYLAGLSFIALCVYRKKDVNHAVMGALVYTFSGFVTLFSIRHPYFTNPLIQLPLLLIGADMILRKHKPYVFILTICYSALCGFYFLYMMTIMIGFYALIRFFDFYAEKRWRSFIAMVGRMIGAYLLGLGLAAPLFVPSVLGFLSSSRTGQHAGFTSGFNSLSYLRNGLLNLIAPPSGDTPMSLAAITLFALVLLLLQRKRRTLKLLFLICFLFYAMPMGGYIMNGFSYTSVRWTFVIMLLLSYVLVEMLPTLLTLNRRQQLLCFGIVLLYGVSVFARAKDRTPLRTVGAVMLTGTLLVLCLFNEKAVTEKAVQRFGALAGALLVVVNVSINGVYRFAKDQSTYLSYYTAYGTLTKNLEGALEREMEPYLLEAPEGRADSSSFTYNTGAIWHIPTAYSYWSIFNQNAAEYWKATENIGQARATSTISGTNGRTITDALLSTKYYIEPQNKSQYVPYGYRSLRKTERGNLLYENRYALPWGYTYDSSISYETLDSMNGLQKEEAMLKSIALEQKEDGGEEMQSASSIQDIPWQVQKLDGVVWEGESLKIEKAQAAMTLEFEMPEQTEAYVYLQGYNIGDTGSSWFSTGVECEGVVRSVLHSAKGNTYYFGQDNFMVNLGYSDNARTTCTIKFPRAGTYKLKNIQMFALPLDHYPEQIEALRAEPLENIDWGTNKVAGTVDLSKNKILCISIPYSTGWTAKVDGKKAEILRGNYMFMALPLKDGHHEIEFTYRTPGLDVGIAASLLSLAGVVLLLCRDKRKAAQKEESL